IGDALRAERMRGELADLSGSHVAPASHPVAIGGFKVGRSGGNASGVLTVSEDDRGLLRVVTLRHKGAVSWTKLGEVGFFVPLDFVYADDEGTRGTIGRRCGNICHRFLMESE